MFGNGLFPKDSVAIGEEGAEGFGGFLGGEPLDFFATGLFCQTASPISLNLRMIADLRTVLILKKKAVLFFRLLRKER